MRRNTQSCGNSRKLFVFVTGVGIPTPLASLVYTVSCFFPRHQSNPKHELDILGQGAHFILHFAEVLGRFALAEHLGLPRHRRAVEVER